MYPSERAKTMATRYRGEFSHTDAAEAFGHLEAAAALGAGGARHARRAGARLAARDAKRFDAILASLAANDARAAVDALARAVRGAAERIPAPPRAPVAPPP